MSKLFEALQRRALYWLAQREQSEAELRRKLRCAAASLLRASSAEVSAPKANKGGDGGLNGLVDGRLDGVADEPDASTWVDEAMLSEQSAVASEPIDQLIDWLRERQYLSNQRFIDSRLRVRQSRFGAQRIANELAQHGLSLSEEDRCHLAETELSRAHAVWTRKFGATPPVEPAARASQTRFLAQRGFSGEVIRRVLRGEGAAENTS